MPLAETSPFAPVGELLILDGGERVVCHLCGRALTMLGATHLKRHGWTAALYREVFGLRRSASLCAPAMTERRRLLGLQRYETNPQLREGLAVGQAMARSGRLLELSHGAQPKGSARAETRRRAGERTAPARQRALAAAQARLHARLVELGFANDLASYLRDGYERRHLPVLALARELGVGNTRIQRELDAAGVVRRRPGGAEAARVRWAGSVATPDPPASRSSPCRSASCPGDGEGETSTGAVGADVAGVVRRWSSGVVPACAG